MSQFAELPLEVQEKLLGFGLVARIKSNTEPRKGSEPKALAVKACPKCSALVDESDILERKRGNTIPETFYFCKSCGVYLNLATREKLGTRW